MMRARSFRDRLPCVALSCHPGTGARGGPLLLLLSALGTHMPPHPRVHLGVDKGRRCARVGMSGGICTLCVVPGTEEDTTDSALVSQYASRYSRTYHTKL